MLAKLFLMFALGVSCIATAATPSPKASVAPVVPRSEQYRQVVAFTRVQVDGKINVTLHTGDAHPQVILHGDPRDLAYVSTTVVDGGLQINLGTGYPRYGAVSADVRGQYLNAFIYRGAGFVTGKNLRSSLLDLTLDNGGKTTLEGQLAVRNLDIAGNGYVQIAGINSPNLNIKLKGKPKVQLAGVVNLTCLDMHNDAWLSMHWIKSKFLKVRSRGASFIQLGGIVEKLDVELWDTAHFNGRYLRAQNAFVKTHDKTVAEISAVNKQHTLASDASDIHFYNIPAMRTDFMAYNGSVLDMRDWNMPFMQEYDVYNK